MKKRNKQTFEEKEKNNDKQHEVNSFLNVNENIKEATELAEAKKAQINQSEDQIIKAAEEEVKKSKSHRSKYFYTICFLINVVSFTIFLLLNSQTRIPFGSLIKGKTIYFVIAFMCFIIITLIEALRIFVLIFKSTKKARFITSFNSSAIARYYDLITPLATGGQSHQISYLSKSGIKGSIATSVPIAKYVFAQLCYLIFIIILLFVKRFGIVSGTYGAGFVSLFAYIGLGVQFLWLATVFLLSVSKRIGPAITIGVLKIANKLRIIKDYKKVYIKVLHFVNDYQTSMRRMVNDIFTFFTMVISSFGVILVRFSVPFFLYCAFFGFDGSMFIPILSRIVLCELAMGIWILPGNVIIADLAFFTIFKPVFVGGTLFWALLFWRLITYYFLIFQGAIVIFITNLSRKIKEARAKEKALAEYYERSDDN